MAIGASSGLLANLAIAAGLEGEMVQLRVGIVRFTVRGGRAVAREWYASLHLGSEDVREKPSSFGTGSRLAVGPIAFRTTVWEAMILGAVP